MTVAIAIFMIFLILIDTLRIHVFSSLAEKLAVHMTPTALTQGAAQTKLALSIWRSLFGTCRRQYWDMRVLRPTDSVEAGVLRYSGG